ncbi:hypothetical protein V8G54_020388 [Vigna mungo]|uniref:Uncharacterized protein n=1 Tax=Vigna mungo TaxID=3915 RepID=A0AAQ3NDP5_VIGMU
MERVRKEMANIRTKEGSIIPTYDNNGLIIQGVVQIKSLLVVYRSSFSIPPSFNSGVMNGDQSLNFIGVLDLSLHWTRKININIDLMMGLMKRMCCFNIFCFCFISYH